jgi:hypothetical protein
MEIAGSIRREDRSKEGRRDLPVVRPAEQQQQNSPESRRQQQQQQQQ